MNYRQLSAYLLGIFNQNNRFEITYRQFINTNNRNLLNSLAHTVNPNINLTVNFPGYKAKLAQNGVRTYDYRIDLNGVAISHTNLVVDLYNKARQAPHLIPELYNFLIDIGVNCLNVNLQRYNNLGEYNFLAPSIQLLDNANTSHRNLNKYFNRGANLRNYSLEELLSTIAYIVLQEDINYPIARGFNGRKMCFSRYIEALIVAQQPNNPQGYSLDTIIRRTLSHTRIQPWIDFADWYGPVVTFI